jgi:heme-degrading monooxygenase HmoA
MPAKPWVTLRPPDPEREYLVLLTALPLQRLRDLGAFLLYTWRILGQLRRTPGVLGYALLARLLQRQFWTLSVWEDETALQQFVVAPPHSHVMQALREKMGQTRFVRWRLRGAEFPPRWPEALARQDAA